MSQPTAYTRKFSFTNDQTANPSTKTPGNQLDIEYNAILLTLNQTLANLALIQRDDGQLANGSVGADQLAPGLATGVSPATIWASPVNYSTNATVFFGYKLYRCLVSHISGTFATDLANGKWLLVGDFSFAVGTGLTQTTGGGGAVTLNLANDVAAIEALSTTGFAARTAAETWALRTVTGTANEITVTNGDGVAGNPTISLPANAITNAKMAQMPSFTLKGNATGSAANPSDISIPALTLKASPAAGDIVLICDTAAGNALKYTTVSAISVAGSVASLNGLTGALTIAGAGGNSVSAAGATVTITAPSVSCEMIINKGVAIDQTWEGATALADGSNNPHPGATRGTETYGPDNWRIGADSGTGNFYAQRSTNAIMAGSKYSLQASVTTADASATATNNYHIEIPIEGPRLAQSMIGSASAQPITVQFWFASGTAGTFALTLCEGTGNNFSCTKTFVYNGSTAPQQYVLTFPAFTTGTWSFAPGTIGAKLIWDLGCGSNFETATPGVWQSAFALRTAACVKLISTLSATVNITGVQADVGSIALPYRFIDAGQDLRDCQRFYYKTFAVGTAVAQNAGFGGSMGYIAQIANAAAGYALPVRYPVPMPNAPTITTFNPGAANAKWRNQSAPADSGTPTIFNPANTGFILYNAQVAGDNAGAIINVHMVANGRMGAAT